MPTHQYDDILNLPRPVSRRHRPMPLEERAVQFAPFAALTSYEEILMEAARPTRDCPQLSEDEQTRLDARLQLLRERIKERPWVTVTWFVPDEKKSRRELCNKNRTGHEIERAAAGLAPLGGRGDPAGADAGPGAD